MNRNLDYVKSDYSKSMNVTKTGKFVFCLVDLDLGGKSLTNNMEAVLKHEIALWATKGFNMANLLIIYKDSNGTWDGVTYDPETGKVDFYGIGVGSIENAIDKADEIANSK